jgi:hypothetical protein
MDMDNDFSFIEINRIVENKDRKQVVVPETISVKDIKTFRPWYKSKTDTFQGEATLIVLYFQNKAVTEESSEGDKKSNLHTMLICEDYANFRDRMSGRVIIMGK